MKPFPEDWELLSFFECEPDVLDDGIPWAYNTLTFRTRRGTDDIECKIEPGYETVDFVWRRDDRDFLKLEFHRVRSVQIETNEGTEIFSATFRDQNLLPFVLRLKPTVHVSWGTRDLP